MENLAEKIKESCNQLDYYFFKDKTDKYYLEETELLIKDYYEIKEMIGEFSVDYTKFIYELKENSNILIEGCNGIMLDNLHGLNPYTTSSSTSVNALLNGANLSPCYLNDVRIYDHALSLAEIQELKKGLIIHYSFDDALAEDTINYSSPTQWGCYSNYWELTINNNTAYRLTKSSVTANETTVALSNNTLYTQMGIGEVWTVSCYLYKNGQPFKTTATSIGTYGLQL